MYKFKTITRVSLLCVGSLSLIACQSNHPFGSQREYHHYRGSEYYRMQQHSFTRSGPRPIAVPQTYHLATGKPVKHSDRDRQWIQKQSPKNYTINVGKSSSAADVANKLHKTPRTVGRGAQYKSKKGYGGVVGNYNSKAEAEKALKKLPSDVRKSAKVQQWQNVQSETKSIPTPSISTIAPPKITQ